MLFNAAVLDRAIPTSLCVAVPARCPSNPTRNSSPTNWADAIPASSTTAPYPRARYLKMWLTPRSGVVGWRDPVASFVQPQQWECCSIDVVDTVDFARVVAEFGPGSALLVEPGSSAAAHVPARWAGIAGGRDSCARRAAAVALWNLDMFELVPRFAAVLDECLDDVRVCLLRGDWLLLYALRKPFAPHEFRIGWDPETFGADLPPHWSALPEALRVFLSTVHAGFTDLSLDPPMSVVGGLRAAGR